MTTLCWIDLETTGSDRDKDFIIEVGYAITTGPDLEIKDAGNIQVLPRDPAWAYRIRGNKVVREMHVKNGLLNDIFLNGNSIGGAEQKVLKACRQYEQKSNQVMMAGSGVGHFDKAFVRNEMPELDKFLAYPVIDVGVIRRTVRMFYPGLVAEQEEAHKKALQGRTVHRGLDDVRIHIEELKFYRDKLFVPPKPCIPPVTNFGMGLGVLWD